jgi:hypothetical protein
MDNREQATLVERAAAEVSRGAVFALQSDAIQREIRAFSDAEIREAVERILTRPVPTGSSPAGKWLMNPALTVQWLETFELLGLPRNLRAYEPCSGASEPVLFAVELYTGGAGHYTTLNLNRPLAQQFREKIGKVRAPCTLIEEPAQQAAAHLAPGSVDVACFHHALNDLLQTAVAEPRGMDTRTVDWWPNERRMIEWLAEEAAAGELELRARPALLLAVEQAVELVRPGGYLLFDHWTWLGHREQAWFPWELFCDLIPLARAWIAAAGFPLTEVAVPGRDPRWWMVLRRG